MHSKKIHYLSTKYLGLFKTSKFSAQLLSLDSCFFEIIKTQYSFII